MRGHPFYLSGRQKNSCVGPTFQRTSFPLCVVSAVGHKLAAVLRYIPGFFLAPSWMKCLNYHHLQDLARLTCQADKFRTGALHPLSFKPVALPSNLVLNAAYASVEILGDHVLRTVMSRQDVCCFYLVSWNLGAVTLVSRNIIQRLRHLSSVTSLLTCFFFPQPCEIELSNRWMPLWTSMAT